MGLSRLDNFLKSVRGNLIYVNPNDLDSTDSVENQGNSLTRPFKTIQRALIEASRFSYQRGLNNDRFGKTSILVYPGDHVIDNRPGWIPDGSGNFRMRNGLTSTNFQEFDLTTNFDIEDPDNILYKFNSIHGGVIIPRGTSLVGLDLRKTKIRPKYIPNPKNDNIERTSIFRVTGGCYFWQFSMFDADPNGQCYSDYTDNTFVPNFSHHKLACFEYADGLNPVKINDVFQQYETERTDLDMYYEKIGLAYGQSSGRIISPDYPSGSVDIESKIDEYRIVGSTGATVGISSIISGDGIVSSTTVTVLIDEELPGLEVDTPIRINSVSESRYNGQFVVSEKVSPTQIKYKIQSAPIDPKPSVVGSSLELASDTVTSASPYIFNVSLRSVYGMCGLLADGSKASGFKSMVVAQFTGIGLQKDDDAFVVFDENSGSFRDNTIPGNENISSNSRAIHKPNYRNFHIKAINDAFIQNVSVFAIGYAEHFAVESGGDMSITNSNSNFGAKSLVANGFRKNAYPKDDLGYITHIIPPKELPKRNIVFEFDSIDVEKTIGVGVSSRLYLYNQTNIDSPPDDIVDGYRIGAKENDEINVVLLGNEYKSRIIMQNSDSSSEKVFYVAKNSFGLNNITNSTIRLTQPHTFITGESVRILGDTGQIPDGLKHNTVYYVITSGTVSGLTSTTDIRFAKTLNDAIRNNPVSFNSNGGGLKVVSRVNDKKSGDIGHPIQFDSNNNQWYIGISSSNNQIYQSLAQLGSSSLGKATSRTYLERFDDNRSSNDTLYRIRYVIPSTTESSGRPPSDGFIIQESNTTIGASSIEISKYFGQGSLGDLNELRNFKIISNASWNSNVATFETELPHKLTVGSNVEVNNVRSSNNISGNSNSGFNGYHEVVGISSAKQFSVDLSSVDPGTFLNDTSTRNETLPHFKRKDYKNIYYILRYNEVQPYIFGEQDGIYYLTVLNASNTPVISPFKDESFSQPVKDLYPQNNKDNPKSDPKESTCFALSSLIGSVVTDDPQNSITKETVHKFISDSSIGVGITNIVSTGIANTHTIHTKVDHGLNRIVRVSIGNSGLGYGYGTDSQFYNAKLVGFAGSTTGQNATAKVFVNTIGEITNVKIMDGGSAYGIGNTLAIVGIPTFGGSGYKQAYVNVTGIYNNVGDMIQVSGVSSDGYSGYNNLYRITEIPVGSTKRIPVKSSNQISNQSTFVSGIGATVTSNSFAYLVGKSLRISSLNYNSSSGIATIVTQGSHGLSVDKKVRVFDANQDLYNSDFIVLSVNSVTSFTINIGVGTTAPSFSGTAYVCENGFSSNDGFITPNDENINGRMIPIYAGISTVLGLSIDNSLTDEISIENIGNFDFNIGDYLLIDDEIVRIKTTTSTSSIQQIVNPLKVFRGTLGTKATNHAVGSVVKKISVTPIEFRRHSITRASGHTFEYVGFGPGNYSTAFPDKQDRQISSAEELLAQSTRKSGGINFYTGMNDKGISYSGNKKLSTVTGQEEIFDTPVQTVSGEDISDVVGLNVLTPIEASFDRLIRVDGGSDGKATSEFKGPVVFKNKITSTSSKGIEASSLFLQGDSKVSRKYSVGISTPSLAGNPGDIVYFNNPLSGGYIGWIYTLNNDWYRFGNISLTKSSNTQLFDHIGISTISPRNNLLLIKSGTSQFSVDGSGNVGIGISANGLKLRVSGNVSIVGTTTVTGNLQATNFIGNGSGLTNLNISATGWTNTSSTIYNTQQSFNVGIGTAIPRFTLEVGNRNITSSTVFYVNGRSGFVGLVTVRDISVSGIITAPNFDLNNSLTGRITAGIVTSARVFIGPGVAGTSLMTNSSGFVGIGSTLPRTKLDVNGEARIKTYYMPTETVFSSSNVVTLDLQNSQVFDLTLNQNVNWFVIKNIPPDYSEFKIRIVQTSNYRVGIDTFRNLNNADIPVLWSNGGTPPNVTLTPGRSDVYRFQTFNGGLTFYGIVEGQNFIN